jgi:hypothetical protein
MDGAIAMAAGIGTKFRASFGRQKKRGAAFGWRPVFRFWRQIGSVSGDGQLVGKDGFEAPGFVLVVQHHDGHDTQ